MEYLKTTREELEELIGAMSQEGWSSKDLFDTAKEWGFTEEGSITPYMEFAKMYLAYRRSMKHRGVVLVRPGTGQWHTLIDVVDEALAFSSENKLERRAGFKLFLDVASKITNSMKLHEIRAKADNIHEHFVAVAICEGDQNPKITVRILDAWESKHLAQTGDYMNYGKEPLQLQYFVEAAVLCRLYGFRPEDFVGMIFNEFAWLGTPKPFHMVGSKAKELLKHGHDQKHGAKKVKRVSLKHITQKRDED